MGNSCETCTKNDSCNEWLLLKKYASEYNIHYSEYYASGYYCRLYEEAP